MYWIQIYTQVYKNVGQFTVNSINCYGSYGPFSTLKNDFCLITLEKVNVYVWALDGGIFVILTHF